MIIWIYFILFYINFNILLCYKSYKTRFIEPIIKSNNIDIKIGVLLPNETKSQCALYKVLPAIDVAIDNVRNKSEYFQKTRFSITYADSASNLAIGPLRAIDIFNADLANVMLGPVSSFMLASVVRYSTSRYKVPILSAEGFASDLGNKHIYQMLTRLAGTYGDISSVFKKIFEKFNWLPRNHPTVVVWYIWHKIDDYECNFQMRPIMNMFKQEGLKYIEISDELKVMGHRNLTQRNISNLERIKKNARLTIICSMKSQYVRDIMLAAHDLELTNGEYVFFNMDLTASQVEGHRPWYNATSKKKVNDRAREAYRSIIMITFRLPDTKKYSVFTKKVQHKSTKFYQYNYKRSDASSCVGLYHDAILLYCKAIYDIIQEKKNITDGHLVTERLRNSNINGITGHVRIDKNGDGYSDYSLLDMNKTSGDFMVVATYSGIDTSLDMNPLKQIDWVNEDNMPPPDTPKCGFDNLGCAHVTPWLIAIITVVIIVFLIVFITFFYIKKKLEVDLMKMSWKIQWEELETSERIQRRRSVKDTGMGYTKTSSFRGADGIPFKVRSNRKTTKKKFLRSDSSDLLNNQLNPPGHSDCHTNNYGMCDIESTGGDNSGMHRQSDGSNLSLETYAGIQLSQLSASQMFAKTAIYKGNVVALKPLQVKNVNINKRVLKEIKAVKDLNNNYIARFIGICQDPENECIVTEYCPKGSLQDVLEDEQIKLDWMFRVFLIQDMCRGMVYLQESIGYHGNLKSSNCLVDSRFVLKITDFGLPSFRKPFHDSHKNNYQYYKNKLWTAPEYLRDPNLDPASIAKADVYSFAIVCQEIIYRSGVFFISDVDIINPNEIIQSVIKKSNPPFRPRLKVEQDITEEIMNIISTCWSEDPNDRYTFQQVKLRLRKLNNDGDNLLDNLLIRMEQYANNLEGIVKQRTQQYLEEKKKAEDLLYSMLPKSVAHQLIHGEPVKAESFDSVTIYFSDICGFTELSANSKPIEVVTLLNELYTLFDSISENYDVYKVETIGDAYMVVSGLPQRNGNIHAKEIASMAIAFLQRLFLFKIPHKPDQKLNIRIGIHTGPVCAGVVGVKMPRYCLFGDTVNTASRMESTGKPRKIHVSLEAKTVLDTFNIFLLTERGDVELKGKGLKRTYWLHGSKGSKDNIVDPEYMKDTLNQN